MPTLVITGIATERFPHGGTNVIVPGYEAAPNAAVRVRRSRARRALQVAVGCQLPRSVTIVCAPRCATLDVVGLTRHTLAPPRSTSRPAARGLESETDPSEAPVGCAMRSTKVRPTFARMPAAGVIRLPSGSATVAVAVPALVARATEARKTSDAA